VAPGWQRDQYGREGFTGKDWKSMSEKGSNPNPLSSRSDGGARPRIVSSQPSDAHREAVAGRPPLFSGISADDYAAISAAARVKEFTRGEVLYLEGDAVGRSYCSLPVR
jgi:hypothetical protein